MIDRQKVLQAISEYAGAVQVTDLDRFFSLALLIAPVKRIAPEYAETLVALYVLYLWDTTTNGTSTQQIASEREGDLQRTYVTSSKSGDAMRNSLWGRMIQDLLAAQGVPEDRHTPAILVSGYAPAGCHDRF